MGHATTTMDNSCLFAFSVCRTIARTAHANAVEAQHRRLARQLMCRDMRPRDFSALVCDMPALKSPVPQDTPGVEILSSSGAFLLLNERRNAAMDAGHATYGNMPQR